MITKIREKQYRINWKVCLAIVAILGLLTLLVPIAVVGNTGAVYGEPGATGHGLIPGLSGNQKGLASWERSGVIEVPDTIRVLMPDSSVQTMDMDEYLKGVVPAEVPTAWPEEILKAQAVAARSFAATADRHPEVGADICTDPGHCQAWQVGQFGSTSAAVDATHKMAVLYQGEVAYSFYFSHCDGHTRSSEEVWDYPLPYCVPVSCPDPFSDLPAHGVGMCQEGGKVFADGGSTYSEIIKYYYTGVDVGVTPYTPAISSISPTSALVGTEVTITGSKFGSSQGSSTVGFNNRAATSYSSWSDTQIKCIVPQVAISGPVAVTTAAGTSNGMNFTAINTPVGNNVRVTPEYGTTVDFEQVTSAGETTSEERSDPQIVGYQVAPGTCRDISTTAGYTGNVSVSLSYSDSSFTDNEEEYLVVLHKEGGDWLERTTGRDTDANTVTGEVGSLSEFVVALPAEGLSTTFYFAEGSCRPGFDPYICIEVPGETDTEVKITYMLADGNTSEKYHYVGAGSRHTVRVKDFLGEGDDLSHDFSAKVESTNGQNIIAERPVYFNYLGKWEGGHDAAGATFAAYKWYFAEGTTRPGFDEWITVLNPGTDTANLTFRYMIEGEGEATYAQQVGPSSRGTFRALDHVGPGKDIGLLVESDQLIVAERPVYFNYQGQASNNWKGGHCSLGTPLPAREWYFAEGTTRSGFDEWLCLMNPGSSDISVDALYSLGEGQGEPVEKNYTVLAQERLTIRVWDEVGRGKDVSVKLTSDSDFIAERPTYFLYQGGRDGGHLVLGAKRLGDVWYFAEGYTGENFEEWLSIQNPGTEDANLLITYYPESGTPIVKAHAVKANTRYTVNVNRDAGSGLALSAGIVSDQPIVCERPVYFRYNGLPGGHIETGFLRY